MKNAVLVGSLITTLLLGGCNSTSGSGGVSPDPRLTSKEFNVDGTSYGVSCGVGAVIGGGLCLLIADSDRRAVCIAAAAAGCAAGMGANALLDNIRENYHTKEAQLDALISQLEDQRQKAVEMNIAAKQVYADDHAKFLQMQKDIKANKASAAQVQKSIAQYNANINVLQENIKAHEKNLASYKEVKSELIGKEKLTDVERQKVKQLDRQIASLQKSINELRIVADSNVEDRNVLNIALEKGVEVKA